MIRKKLCIKIVFAFLVFAALFVTSASAVIISSYTFDGNANDSVGTNDGTVTGATLTTDRFGNANSAYLFDGDNDYITTSNMITPDFTISLWINTSETSSTGANYWEGTPVVTADVVGVGYDDFMLTILNDNLTFGADKPLVSGTGGNVVDGDWHQVVVTQEVNVGSNVFLDGAFVFSAATSNDGALNQHPNLDIGGAPGFTSFFSGSIDDLQIFDNTLTAAEVSLLFDEQSAPPVPEPTTMLLLGSGIAGLAGVRRRRANKA